MPSVSHPFHNNNVASLSSFRNNVCTPTPHKRTLTFSPIHYCLGLLLISQIPRVSTFTCTSTTSTSCDVPFLTKSYAKIKRKSHNRDNYCNIYGYDLLCHPRSSQYDFQIKSSLSLLSRKSDVYEEEEEDGEDFDFDEEEEKEIEEEFEYGKFQLDSTSTPNRSSTTTTSSSNIETQTLSLEDETIMQIEQQQKQINTLMEMIKSQNEHITSSTSTSTTAKKKSKASKTVSPRKKKTNSSIRDESSTTLPPPLPGMFDDEMGEEELLDYSDQSSLSDGHDQSLFTTQSPYTTYPNTSNNLNSEPNIVVPLAPLKAMLFIDGTWLYYSLHRRKEHHDPIVKKFGRGWQYKYRFDWNALPRIVCEQIMAQQQNSGWSSTGSTESTINSSSTPNGLGGGIVQPQRSMEIVRASVFTSYKKTTDPKSFRVKMYNEMANANYDLHMLESVGNGPEKCVDISLAVDMLHYATVPNAYDVAILLSGDKDFIPALVRTRQKGRKVGIVAMKTGCNRALYESPHIKDFDVVWIDDFLDRLLVPLPPDQVDSRVETVHDRGLLSAFTITKVIYDFISKSPFDKVSSRDVGRYLKGVEIKDGTNLLDDVKLGQGGLRRFLQEKMPSVFAVIDRTAEEKYGRNQNDKSYWISVKGTATNAILSEAKTSSFTDEEKQFLTEYQAKLTDGGALKETAYYYTIESTTETFIVPKAQRCEELLLDPTFFSTQPTEVVPEIEYSTLTVAKLKELCRERGLQVSGSKAVLVERIKNDDTVKKSIENRNNGDNVNVVDPISKYLEDLVIYYIKECGDQVTSRDLGRFLATNKAYKSDSQSALQELKDIFGGVASFLNARGHLFTTIRDQTDSASPNNYSFGIRLKEESSATSPQMKTQPQQISNLSSRSSETDRMISKHIESLIKEYLSASGGETSSRNIGRYLAANAALNMSNHRPSRTALQQLKENYGSLASYLSCHNDIFSTVQENNFQNASGDDPSSQHAFGVRLKQE